MTPEYIQICRRLNLPRTFEAGDAVILWATGVPDSMTIYQPQGRIRDTIAGPFPDGSGGLTWAPREGDLLDLLETEGVEAISFEKTGFGDWWLGAVTRDGATHNIPHPDRKTALARLLADILEVEL